MMIAGPQMVLMRAAAPLAGPLGATPVFKCSSTICYSADGAGVGRGADLMFRSLQQSVNRYAGGAGFAPVKIDGFIGTGVVAALNKIITWAMPRLGAAQFTEISKILPWVLSKEAVAQNADKILFQLNYVAGLLSVPGAGPLPTITAPAAAPPAVTYTLPPASPASQASPSNPGPDQSASPSIFQKKHWAWYVAGGIMLAGLGTATYLVWK